MKTGRNLGGRAGLGPSAVVFHVDLLRHVARARFPKQTTTLELCIAAALFAQLRPLHRSFRFSETPTAGGGAGAAASSRKATMTYPTRTIFAAMTAKMAEGVEEPNVILISIRHIKNC